MIKNKRPHSSTKMRAFIFLRDNFVCGTCYKAICFGEGFTISKLGYCVFIAHLSPMLLLHLNNRFSNYCINFIQHI